MRSTNEKSQVFLMVQNTDSESPCEKSSGWIPVSERQRSFTRVALAGYSKYSYDGEAFDVKCNRNPWKGTGPRGIIDSPRW
jgi:hypothetical protein